MEIVGVRNYRFSDDEVASIIVGTVNMYVVVKTRKWLFVMCPKIEVNNIPLVVYSKDLSIVYGGEPWKLFREQVGVAIDESTFRTYDDLDQEDLQRRYVDTYTGIYSSVVQKWSNKVLKETKSNHPKTITMVKLDGFTFVQVIDRKEHFLSKCGNDIFTYLYDGLDCGITSIYSETTSSLYTRIGALALDEVSTEDRFNVTLHHRLVIGNAFRTYRECMGIDPKRGIWSEPL